MKSFYKVVNKKVHEAMTELQTIQDEEKQAKRVAAREAQQSVMAARALERSEKAKADAKAMRQSREAAKNKPRETHAEVIRRAIDDVLIDNAVDPAVIQVIQKRKTIPRPDNWRIIGEDYASHGKFETTFQLYGEYLHERSRDGNRQALKI